MDEVLIMDVDGEDFVSGVPVNEAFVDANVDVLLQGRIKLPELE